MNDEDLRDCFAMFALAGAVMSGRARSAEDIWKLADEMLEARNAEPEQEVGIVAAKPRRKKSA
jgi:negative regulator of sigma E activity